MAGRCLPCLPRVGRNQGGSAPLPMVGYSNHRVPRGPRLAPTYQAGTRVGRQTRHRCRGQASRAGASPAARPRTGGLPQRQGILRARCGGASPASCGPLHERSLCRRASCSGVLICCSRFPAADSCSRNLRAPVRGWAGKPDAGSQRGDHG